MDSLKEILEKYEFITNNTKEVIVEINGEGKFTYVSPQIYDMLGYRSEELLDFNAYNFINTEDLHDFKEEIQKTLETGCSLFSELRFKHENGEYIPISLKGNLIKINSIIKIIFIIRKITKPTKLSHSLKLSKKNYLNVIENTFEGYFETDLKGHYLYANAEHCKILGYSKEELIGNNFRSFFTKESNESIYKQFNQVFRTGIPLSASTEFKLTTKKNKTIYFEGLVDLLYDSEGNKIGFFGFSRDITERKKLEIMRNDFTKELENQVVIRTKELKELLEKQELYIEEILKSSRFKSEFMSIMSHELRTPMNSIIGFSDLLIEGTFGPLNKNQENFLLDIQDSANHLLSLINQILDISKIESGNLKLKIRSIDVKKTINQIKGALKPLYLKKNLTFRVIGLKDRTLNADPIRFREILYNLLNNAIKYTIKGCIILKISENADEWIFDVTDTGIGIAEEHFNLIFLDFSRINHPYVKKTEGTGLGLSLTKRLVELHGGYISFKSILEKGSTFSFTIPKNLKVD